jgi:hypothetical protein
MRSTIASLPTALAASAFAVWAILAPVEALAAGGLNLGVSTCGPSASHSISFACDGNEGSDEIVGSVVSPYTVSKLLGIEAQIWVCFPSEVQPDWWRVDPPGCRSTSVTADLISPPGSCFDYWAAAGGATGGITSFDLAGNGFRILIDATVDSAKAGPIATGTEYFLFRLIIAHAKTTGPGACAGCSIPANLTFASLGLRVIGQDYFSFSSVDRNNVVTWQGGGSCYALPVRNRTWGAVKSLYR